MALWKVTEQEGKRAESFQRKGPNFPNHTNWTFSNYESRYNLHSERYTGQRQWLPCLFLSSDSLMVQEWGCHEHGGQYVLSGDNRSDFPSCFLDHIRSGKGHFVVYDALGQSDCVWLVWAPWFPFDVPSSQKYTEEEWWVLFSSS